MQETDLADIVDMERYPVGDTGFGAGCAATLAEAGVLVLPGFIRKLALTQMQQEAAAGEKHAYFCAQSHSVYLTPEDPTYPSDHPANRQVISSKFIAPGRSQRALFIQWQSR